MSKNRRNILKYTLIAFKDDKASQIGASMAYYTVFALPPLLVLLVMLLSSLYGGDAARSTLTHQLESYMGKAGMGAIHMILDHLNEPSSGNAFAATMSICVLIFSATGAFVQLQGALNTVWGVKVKPGIGWKKMVLNRLMSFSAILILALLSSLTVILDFVLALLQSFLAQYLNSEIYVSLFQLASFLVSLGVMALLFAVLFKFLPDVKVAWKDVLIGGLFTSALFTLGKVLITLYLSFSSLGSAYGAAGSMMILLFWIFLSMQILLLGAEYTWAHAFFQGHRIEPAEYAMWLPGYEKRVQALEVDGA